MRLLLSLIFCISLASCTFLKTTMEGEDSEEVVYSGGEDGEEEWDEEDLNGDEEDEDGEDDLDEDMDEEDEDEDYDDEEDEEEEEEDESLEVKKKKRGFFARLFGIGEDSDEDEEEDIDEDEDFDEDEDYDDEEDEDGGEESDFEEGEGADFIEDGEITDSAAEDFADKQAEPSVSPESQAVSPPPITEASAPSVQATPEPKQLVPVKKVKTQAYRKGAYLVNGVYIARSGDTLESVSQKIYNGDQLEALYTINPHFRSKTLKVGDKVYYNSPRRPQDSSGILIYYEDFGVPSPTYEIASGQNIRSVSAQLLGHKDSWKEIWATNPNIISKGIVSETFVLRYWPEGTSTPSFPDEAQEPTPTETVEEAQKQEDSAGPSVEMEDTGIGDFEDAESPSDKKTPDSSEVSENRKKGFDIGQIFLIGAFAAVILLSLIMFVKKRRKKREFDYTATNIKPPA